MKSPLLALAGFAFSVICAFLTGVFLHRSVRADNPEPKALALYGCTDTQSVRVCKVYDPETQKRFVVVEHFGLGGTAITALD
jgi:hypothetical protein